MITSTHLAKIFPGTSKAQRDRFLPALNKFLPLYGIHSLKRVCAFLATGGVETDYLRTTTEYASGKAYEGREDLGNTQKGDGRKFKGRGFFQTTGRYNFGRVNKRLGKKLGIDFLAFPERLSEIEIAVESACIFWEENELAKYADAGNFKAFSAVVNCGNPKKKPNHWAKRNTCYAQCLNVIPKDFSFSATSPLQSKVQQNQAVIVSMPVHDLPATSYNTPTATGLGPIENSAEDLAVPSTSYVSDAIDNLPSDEIKTAAKTHAPNFFRRLWRILIRPLSLVYAALEAGNIYAWLGLAVAVAGTGLMLYWHRDDLRKASAKLKEKFLK
ncbi:MAG: hypothetical protein LUM44_09925 [Pyrinomonadaceae bacterium]|nr:hypothetical protein [Pyrinomonadaceae bacterium]